MAIAQKYTHKRGDTFVLQGRVMVDGVAQDISGWALPRAQVRDKNTLVEELTVSKIDGGTSGYYLIKSAKRTDSWPAKDLSMDVEYVTPADNVVSTDTITIACVPDVTQEVL